MSDAAREGEAADLGPAVGIDLGTTHSLVAVCERGRPRILSNSLGELLTPSVVSFADDGVLVGTAALERSTLAPDRTFEAFKRDMGTERVHAVDGRAITPVQLSAMVLRTLKEEASARLGQPVQRAVISVPAYFDENQRRATRDAADLAGIEVLRLINEPTAAAIAHGLVNLDREMKVVVLDLGGGTFDVTVVEIIEGVIEIQSSAGDSRLGGDDFTEILARWAVEQRMGSGWARSPVNGDFFRASNPAWRRILRACEIAKRHLSRQPTYGLCLQDLQIDGQGRTIEAELDRARAEELWQPVLGRLRAPIRRALADAGISVDEVDRVLLVGGASRMPCFVELATKIFGREPSDEVPVDEVVAHGAALQAALTAGSEGVEDLIVTDVAAFSMGVEVIDYFDQQMVGDIFSPILERGTVLPSSRRRIYSTAEPDQEKITLRVYQGEHPTCSQNIFLGELPLDGIPAGPAGVPIEVRFSYDLNGVLEVEATVMGGEARSVVLEQASGRLGKDELERARAALDAIKFHPRDALPNTAALAKAEALYLELRGRRRDDLGTIIAHFRQTIELGSDPEIEEARQGLSASLEVFR